MDVQFSIREKICDTSIPALYNADSSHLIFITKLKCNEFLIYFFSVVLEKLLQWACCQKEAYTALQAIENRIDAELLYLSKETPIGHPEQMKRNIGKRIGAQRRLSAFIPRICTLIIVSCFVVK